MDKFLEKYSLSRLNQEEIENMYRPIISTEIKTVTKNIPTNKSSGPESFISEFYQMFREELTLSCKNSSKKLQREENLQILWGSITLIPKLDKGITKKENYKPISLMNIDAKALKTILENIIQQHIKRIIHYDQVGLSL